MSEQQPSPRWQPPEPTGKGVPRWAVGAIAGGGALAVVGFIGAMIWLGTLEDPGDREAAAPTAEAREKPREEPREAEDAHRDADRPQMAPETEQTERNSGIGATEDEMQALVSLANDTYEKYSTAMEDRTIYEMVPGGESVDPDYIGAFLFLLADYKGAANISSSFGGASPAEVAELTEEITELERRFLAGEDLGPSVKYTRADGTAFESDGKYRTIK